MQHAISDEVFSFSWPRRHPLNARNGQFNIALKRRFFPKVENTHLLTFANLAVVDLELAVGARLL